MRRKKLQLNMTRLRQLKRQRRKVLHRRAQFFIYSTQNETATVIHNEE